MTTASSLQVVRDNEPGQGHPRRRTRVGQEIYGFLILAFSILLLLSLVSFDVRDVLMSERIRSTEVQNLIGPVGAHIAKILYGVLGVGAYFVTSTFFYFGGLMLARREVSVRGGGLVAYLVVLVFGCTILHVALHGFFPFSHVPGGAFGEWTGELLRVLFATTGTVLIATSLLIAGVLRLSGLSLRTMIQWPGAAIHNAARAIERGAARWRRGTAAPEESTDERAEEATSEPLVDETPLVEPAPVSTRLARPQEHTIGDPEPALKDALPEALVEPTAPSNKKASTDPEKPSTKKKAATEAEGSEPEIAALAPSTPPPMMADQSSLPLKGPMVYEPPSLSLLDYEPPQSTEIDREALNNAARRLEAKLLDFGVKGQVVKIQPGPVITMFEFLPAPGIKISKIANLADDLTMALHAQRVRIIAPIPGKGVVGIEVPSAIRETVYLKEILASPEFQDHKGTLPVALGKDIVGHPVVVDLAKMPHVLVAGATGSGKSVAINAIICSLLYRHKPDDLKMILVDPKMLELSVYDDIPHLLLPVVTESKKASLALKWAVTEMERRYRLLAAVGVRNMSGFNKRIEAIQAGKRPPPENVPDDELERLPHLVIILDELADLMMVSGKEVESSIARLAQMARAAGIHLVVATQRPSVDVITGLIKANFPTRISFQVAQKVDSRTILDRMGAEALLGQGDMLYLPPGTSAITRVQGCFVGDDEVTRVAAHLVKFGPPDYDMNILLDDDAEKKDLSGEDYDVLFDQAVAIVTETGNPSISYLQRRLKIGYNRSARIIERMEHDAIITSPDHRGARKVLAPPVPPE
jgi:S-DNA-T family DNA segregation ATPase FtsK/SpoIIIE